MGADTSTLKGTSSNAQLQWLSNLSPGYIMKLKERVEYASDDFTLDQAALKQFFKCSDREVKILFDHFDMDGNGKIDSYEFVCSMAMLSHATLEEKAELIFNLYDFDGNKYISRDELVILMTNVLSAMNSMNQKPAPSIKEIEAKTDDFFKKADTDGDKKITLTEFKTYITKDKEILEILLHANVAKREDLGADFGNGEGIAPDVDPDLENEINPKQLQKSQKKQNIKDGVDASVVQDSLFNEEEIGDGDQFMAIKPWKGVVDHSVPSNYKPSPKDGNAPDASLQLEYIHGYRCHDARDNLKYTATGEIVYHAAGVGIVLNQKTNTQKFFMQHNDDIHCLAIDPTGKFCATGQIGPKPSIYVWNNDTMQCVASMQGTLLKGIKNIAFSPDGKYLAASAFDDNHCIAVYAWNSKLKPGETLKPVASGKGPPADILSLGFNPQGNTIVATGVKEVNFYTFDGGLIKGKKGIGWKNNQQAVLCQAFIKDTLYTGLFDGAILSWNGNSISGSIKAHAGCCNALISRKQQAGGLISGGGDGLIIIWQLAGAVLQQVKQLDLKAPEIKSMLPKVRSLYENIGTGQILVGTRGGEIIEFGGPKPLMCMRSHFEGELWGLATHPTREEFITVGEDSIMAIWDVKTRKQKRFGKLEQAGKVCAYSSSGSLLAIGYNNGSFNVLDIDNKFAMKANKKDRKEAISEIKFSPGDNLCAVGAHDSQIILYDVKQNFKPTRRIRGHPSTIAHFDFSLDEKVLMSNCTSYNILFFDTSSGKNIPSGASMYKNEPWASWTCTFGWPVQGIFPPCADGTDLNACDRAPDGVVLATGDDFGMVKIFKYPCPVEKASFHQNIGHSSHVTNVRFLKNSPYLISTGGADKCIFQWKYTLDNASHQQSKQAPSKVVMDLSNIEDDIGEIPVKKTKPAAQQVAQPDLDDDENNMFHMEDQGEGDQRLAVLPFKGEVDHSIPSGFRALPNAGDKPDGNLKLKYAHGFRSFDTRGNLKYSSANDIIFTTAALGVVLNKPSNTQRFFNLHDDDVVSMAIHPSKDIAATGQMAAKGKSKLIDIFVWRISTLEVLAHINNFHRGAIRKLEFSPAGDKLLSIGEDDQFSVAVYDWASGKILCKSPVDDRSFDACWKDEQEFATVGLKKITFFNIQGANVKASQGIFGSIGITPLISCCYAFNEKVLLTGTPKGDLMVWNGRNCGKPIKKHTDALWSIQNIQNNTLVMTGGNDAKVIFWDKTFAQKLIIDLAPMSKFPAGVRSLDYNEQAKTLIVGTRSAEIIEVSAAGKKLKTLLYGHFQGTQQAELWGCAVHPKEDLFASCGADKTIRIWKENQMLQVSDLFENDLTSLDWSNDGNFLVTGDRNGMIHLVDAKTLAKLASATSTLANKKNAWVEDLKISPNSQIVAFGTHGGLSKIELVKVDGKKLTKIASVDISITSALTHLDWSIDSRSVVVNSQAYELMWLDVTTKKRIMASSAKDIDWHTWTSVLGFQVQGIWPEFSDFSDVNSVCRSNNRRILASADDFGLIKLFKYPCTVEKAQFNKYTGHSSHVTKVKFTHNDRYVVSTGGNDKTVLVWETDFGDKGEADQIDEEDYQMDDRQAVDAKPAMVMSEVDCEDFSGEVKIDRAKLAKNREKVETKKANMIQSPKVIAESDNPFFEEADMGDGDEFMAIEPWKGQIKEPTGYKKPPVNQSKAPSIQLELEWVHGYRSHDARNNIGFLQDQSIVYHAAALGVCYDPSTHTQRFFNTHTDDVTAIAFSPDKRLIATGEIGAKPVICIWDAITMQLKFTLRGKILKGVQGLSFSNTGKTLAAVAIDADPNHCIAVYNTDTGTCIGSANGGKQQILGIAMKDDTTFSTSGIKHFKQWTVGANLTGQDGNFGKFDPRHGLCAYMGELCLSGAITGELYVWSGPGLKTTKKLHERPLDSIHVSPKYVFTGGKDSKVCILETGSLNTLFTFTINEQQWGSVCGKVRALCLNDNSNILFVGTLGSEIYQVPIDMAKKTIGQPKNLITGHYSPSLKDNNEAWGLATFPNKATYVTVSDDGTLRQWDTKSRKQINCVSLLNDETGNPLPLNPQTQEASDGTKGRSLDVSPDGKLCAVGFRDGSLRIYNTNDWSLAKRIQLTNMWIQDLKFSPDQKLLAVSSHDRKVYVLATNNYAKKAICKASSAAITHLDWSLDSKKLHTNDRSYELLYYQAETGTQDTGGASSMRDEAWATWSLPLGWPVQGIWPPCSDGSDINAVARSNQPHRDGYFLLASVDDFSKVNVFRYPSVEENSEAVVGRGHSSHVTMVKFSKDDQYLFSAGGNDTCVFQWKVNNAK